MFNSSEYIMFSRGSDVTEITGSDRLRRAGYQDGEREPRVRQHWINHGMPRRLHRRARSRS